MKAQLHKKIYYKLIIKPLFFITLNFLILWSMACQDRLIVLWDETYSVKCRVSDVVLLLDTTSSMDAALNSVKSMLNGTIIPGLSERIEDLQIGIATYQDIPYDVYGSSTDLPLKVVQKMTDNFSIAQSAVNSVGIGNGGDNPESLVEALYLISTNESLGSWFSPQNCGPDRLGAMCFRNEATPIIIVITNSVTHNGPGGINAYSGITTPILHTYSETINALNSIGAHVLGINTSSNLSTIPDLIQLSIDTEGVDKNGDPVVVNLSGGVNSGQTVVDIISSYCFSESE